MCGHCVFKCVKNRWFFIDVSDNAEIRNFKIPYKTVCVWMNFDFRKHNALKNVGIYILFENREISHVKKNVIKPYDLSTFQF